MRGVSALAALMTGSALCLATNVAGQEGCDLLQSRSSAVQLTGDGFFNYISEPVFGCEGGVIIRADSAVLDDVSGFTRFIGNFEYRDSTAFMTADRADHFASAGRLIGVGNVHINDEATGAVFEGDSTVLVGSGSRREEGELTVVGRDGRRAHAVILVSPRDAPPDSSETDAAPDTEESANDSAAILDSAAAEPDSTATEPDSTAAEPEEVTPPADTAVAPTPDPPPRDTTPVPYYVDAQHILMQGAGRMWATGDAELYNDDFRALADSIEYREEAGRLLLRGTAPSVHGYGTDYVLSGAEVDMDLDGNQVTARGDADLSGSEINMTAPEIRVLMREGALDRIVAMNERPPEPEVPEQSGDEEIASGDSAAMVATAEELAPDSAVASEEAQPEQPAGPETGEPVREDATLEAVPVLEETTPVPGAATIAGTDEAPAEPGDSTAVLPPARPRAVAETFELEGDSIDVRAPGQVLERVVAVGNARGESFARDSLNNEHTPDIARSDWVSGDTIIAIFRPVAPSGTPSDAGADSVTGEAGGGYQLDRLDARGQAATLYRMTPSGGGAGEDDGEGEEAASGDETDGAQPTPGEEVPAENVLDQPARQPAEEAVAAEEEVGGEERVAEEEVSDDPAQQAAEEPPEAEPDTRLALHYVRGDQITIFMQDGEVTSVIVAGDASGVQLEPVAAATSPPDTTAVPPSNRR